MLGIFLLAIWLDRVFFWTLTESLAGGTSGSQQVNRAGSTLFPGPDQADLGLGRGKLALI